MTDQEIKQLKVISLNTSQGNLDTALSIYKWLIEKTSSEGYPVAAPQEEGDGLG